MVGSRDSKTEIFNKGLELSLKLGAEGIKPIHDRLSKFYPKLTAERLAQVEDTCRRALELGHNLTRAKKDQLPDLSAIETGLTDLYPWISQKNLQRILQTFKFEKQATG